MNPTNDPKKKFIEALEKKKMKNIPAAESNGGKSKLRGSQASGKTPKIFRRKSGSS